MATPMTADQLISQFKKWEVPYNETPGWRTYGRDDETGQPFGPVYGGGMHHTGSDGPDWANREVIIKGRSDLPGPLAHFGGNDNGVIDIISIGRANHFGGGDPDVLQSVINESYTDYPPPTDKHQGEVGAVDGNDRFYGLEAYYSGSVRMTPELYKSSILVWAAVCDFHEWTAKSIIGHGEWSDWKWDPGYLDMKLFREDIQTALEAGPKGASSTPKFKTPHITASIKANIKYDQALDEIKGNKVKLEAVSVMRAELKRQRRALRELERK